MKYTKYLAFLGALFAPLLVLAINVTVPAAPGSGDFLSSTSTGAWVATSTPYFPLGWATGATSTGSNGINITNGCFAKNGVCVGSSGSGTVTSIASTNGLAGGTITTSGTLYLTNFFATSTGETDGQLPFWTTTNGTPAKFGSVATTSHAFSGPFGITGTIGALVGGSNSTVTWTGLATTSQPASSNLLESNGAAGVFGVATSSPTVTGPITYSGTLGAFVGGVGGTFACATCNTSNATVSSIVAGTGLNGGTITTSGTISLKSYFGTTTADTAGQALFWTSTNATPATIGSNSNFTFATANNLLTATNASTTAFSATGFLAIPTSASCTGFVLGSLCLDTTNNQLQVGTSTGGSPSVYDPRRFLTFTYATTTAWSGTTTIALGTAPSAIQFQSLQCYTDAGTLDVQLQYGAGPTTVNPMIIASTTAGVNVVTGSGTPSAGGILQVKVGTPVSTPLQISCTASALTSPT